MLSRALLISKFFKDPDKKSIFTIVYELFVYGWTKKEFPTDYFRKFLYRKNVINITSYLSLKEYYKIIDSEKILVPDIAAILESKLSFSLFADKHHLSSPRIISYNIGNYFYFNSKPSIVNTKSDLIDFFTMVFDNINESSLFLKPINGIGGIGCILLNKEKFKIQISDYYKTLLKQNYIHQEKIIQHSGLNKIYSKSINSLRINTYLDEHGKSHVISALMRFGTGNLITDNETSGGFYIALNLETGILSGVGRQDIKRGGNIITHHPDTKTQLDGFKVPFIKESVELALLAAKMLPTRIVGWDIALTNNGPVLIEGNSNPSLHMADVAFKGLCKHPLIKQILKEI
ncbi:hypothetical protein N1F78_14550 [Seonamhaeicola sp. MEBiC1930]|uniref:sugar-transfer associated ATP-grasp domain-containing protein n=1 Tax=Seonamhaeicola sp. MEBiC01930 TaxID=2976768 RepID=UPI00324A120E